MCPIRYYTMIRSSDHRETIRRELVRFAQQHGIKPAARRFGCCRNTVRKWLRRWQQGKCPKEQSRRPGASPSRTQPKLEAKVVQLRTKTRYGPHRLADWLRRTQGQGLFPWTIRNILKRGGLLRRSKRRKTLYPAH